MRLQIMAIVVALGFGPGWADAGPRDEVLRATRLFLDAYARGDAQAVLAKVDPGVVIYGSDIDEVFRGESGARLMLTDDQKLWRGAAKIGEMRNLSMVSSQDLAVLTFQAPFILGPRPSIVVRFSMVWRKSASGWRLVQSNNSAPTVGQSGAALLAAEH